MMNTTNTDYAVVVSTENNYYQLWQCVVFASCCDLVGIQSPIFVVHNNSGLQLISEFLRIKEFDCKPIIIEAANFSCLSSPIYTPYNSPASLAIGACVAKEKLITLWDADMAILNHIDIPPGVTGELCSFLDFKEPRVVSVAEKLNIDIFDASKYILSKPVVLPGPSAVQFATDWINTLLSFEKPHNWIDEMYAFSLTASKWSMSPNHMQLVRLNCNMDEPSLPVIHYAYESHGWSKHKFTSKESLKSVFDSIPDIFQAGSTGFDLRSAFVSAGSKFRNLSGLCF